MMPVRIEKSINRTYRVMRAILLVNENSLSQPSKSVIPAPPVILG
jgi:hypothetical protein